MTRDSTHDAWRRALNEELNRRDLPPEDQLSRLQNLRSEFHFELALAAEAAVNESLRKRDCGDLASRRELCSWANGELRQLGLAFFCTRTRRPAILIADARDADDTVGRFRLEVRGPEGQMIRTLTARSLPHLQLVPDGPRVEPLARTPGSGPRTGPSR